MTSFQPSSENQPHDSFFKTLMEQREVAQKFFQFHFSQNGSQKVLEKMDLNCLVRWTPCQDH